MALHNLSHNTFEFLVKNQAEDQKRKSRMRIGKQYDNPSYIRYRSVLMNRIISAIAIPIFVWLVLETFFK